MDNCTRLPTVSTELRPQPIDNHTIHEEPPQHVPVEPIAQPEVAPSNVVVAPASNLAVTSNVAFGENATKRKSRPFRRVIPK